MRTIQIPYIFLLISTLFVFYSCDATKGDADRETFRPLPEDYDIAFHAAQFFDDPLPDTRYERKDGSIIVPLPGFEKTPYIIDRMPGEKPKSQVRPLYSGYEVFKEGGRYGVRKDDGTVTVPPVSYSLSRYITAHGNIYCSDHIGGTNWIHGVISVENRVVVPMGFKNVNWVSSDVILARTDTSATAFTPQGDTIYHLSPLKDFYLSGNDIVEGTLNHYNALTGRKSPRTPGQFIALFLIGVREINSLDAEPDRLSGLTRKDVYLEGVFTHYRSEYENYGNPSPHTSTPGDTTNRFYVYTYNDTTYVALHEGFVRKERYIDRDKTGERFIALRNTLGGNSMHFPVCVEKFLEISGDSIVEVSNLVELTPGGRARVRQTRNFGRRIRN